MKDMIRRNWRLLLFGFLMTFWSSPGQTFFISLFSKEIRADLSLSHGEFSALYSLATLTSAILMIWSGPIIDRVDIRKFAMAVVAGLTIGCLSMSFSTGLITIFISLLIQRQFGQGLMFLASTTTMIRYLENNKGKATAISSMGYSVSEAIMPSIVIAVVLLLGWRMSWIVFAIAMAVCMVLAILFLLRGHDARHAAYLKEIEENEASCKQQYKRKQWTRNEVIRDKRFYLFLPGLLSQSFLFTGFIFHQVYLVETKGWSMPYWGGLFSIYALVSVSTTLMVGFLVDRIGAVKLVPIISLPMALGLILLSMTSNPVIALIFLVLTGITVGFSHSISAPFWAEMYGNKHYGSIKSLSTALMVLSSAISPVCIGWLIDHGTHINDIAVGFAIYSLLASALAWYGYRISTHNGVVIR